MDQRFCQLVFMRAYLHRIYKLDLASKVVGDWADMGTSRFMSQTTDDSKHCKVAPATKHADCSAQPSEAADTSLVFDLCSVAAWDRPGTAGSRGS